MSRLYVYDCVNKGKTILASREGITDSTDIDNNGLWVHPPTFNPNLPIDTPRFRPPPEDVEEHFFILRLDSGYMDVSLDKKSYLFSNKDRSYFTVPTDPKNLIYDSHKEAIYNQELGTTELNFLYSNNHRHIIDDSFPIKFMHYDGDSGAFGYKAPDTYSIVSSPSTTTTTMFPYEHSLDSNGEYLYYNINPVIDRNKEKYGFPIYIKPPNKGWVSLHDNIKFLRQFIVCDFFSLSSTFENLGGGNLVWTGNYTALGETPQAISKGMSYFYPNMNSHQATNYGSNGVNFLRNNHTVNSGGTFFSDGVSYTQDGIMRPNMLRYFTYNPFSTDLIDKEGSWSIRWNFFQTTGMYPLYPPQTPLPTYDTSSKIRNFPDFIPSTNYTEVSNWVPSVPYYDNYRNSIPIFFMDNQSYVFDDIDEEITIKIVSYRLNNPQVKISYQYTTAISNYTPSPIYSPPTSEFFELKYNGVVLTNNFNITLNNGVVNEIKIKIKKPQVESVKSNIYSSFFSVTPLVDPEAVNNIEFTVHWAPPQIRSTIDMVELRLGSKIKQTLINNFCPCIIDNTEYYFIFQKSFHKSDVKLTLECVNQPNKVSITPLTLDFQNTEQSLPLKVSWTGNPTELEYNKYTDVIIKGVCSSTDLSFDSKVFYYNIRVYPNIPPILWDTRSNSSLFGFLHFESSDVVDLVMSKFFRQIIGTTEVTIKFLFLNNDIILLPAPTIVFNSSNWNLSQTATFNRNPSSYEKDKFQTIDIMMESSEPSYNGIIGKLFVCTRYPISYNSNLPIKLSE